MKKTISFCISAVAGLVWMGGVAWAGDGPAAETILDGKCGKCHERTADGKLNRINAIRATPEGWGLTLRRMRDWHHIDLSAEDGAVLVKYLSDRQGLAPEEVMPFRAVLERRPGHVEADQDADIAVYCARCHSYARVGLQHRDTEEWVKLAHTHLGQFPTLEYQDSSRNREWWKHATTDIAAKLGEKWPFATAAWTAWQTHKTADLAGRWRVIGHRPGKGDYAGILEVKAAGGDRYQLAYHLAYADGGKLEGAGKSILYTGFQWRGSVTLGKEEVNEVYMLSADGNALSGRWFLEGDDVIGGDLTAVRETAPTVLAVQPSFLKAGQSAQLTIIGSGLAGAVDLGPGVKVEKVVSASGEAVTVIAKADAAAVQGSRPVSVGGVSLANGLAVYAKIDKVTVEPPYAIARTGGNGGPIAAVPTQFEAVAYAGDLRLGVMPAKWSTAPFDAAAAALKDERFAGRMGPGGLFQPAGAGPSAKRNGTNNVGNLTVTATVADGAAKVAGTAHLIVTVQRWNDASIK